MTELDVVAPSPSAVRVRPGSLRAWVLACRPPTLIASFVPVAVGTACARAAGGFRLGPALAALVAAALLQIGCNFANDVFDHEKGADTAERLGPMRAVSAGLLSAAAVRRGMLVVFALSVAIGVYLTAVAGPIIIAIGFFSILSAIAYTGGPYPLGYHGLGDLFVLVFFGFVAVCGTAFVEVDRVPELAIWSAVPVGALATAILVVNNLRDAETDVRAGKHTLAVRFGERGAVVEYWALLAMSYAVPVLLVARGALGVPGLLPLLALPLAIKLGRGVARQRGRALNALLVLTAKHLFAFGVLFTAGILANIGA